MSSAFVAKLATQCDKCGKYGNHLCEKRANRVRLFFEKVLVHTKGPYAGEPFILAKWQWEEIIRPLFGCVEWSDEFQLWVRAYSIAWIEVARKNGKSELLAGIALYLLIADGEQGADIYGVARDREQAGVVFNVAARMVQLSDRLAMRLRIRTSDRLIGDDETGSFYTTLPSDELGNLGLNPHGVILDEALAQRDAKLFNVLRQGMGTRTQPLMCCATTAGTMDAAFYISEHDYSLKVMEDPTYDPARFAFIRNTPRESNPWDEANWPHANPALGDYLSLSFLRKEARLAQNDPTKESSFRQYHLNQIVSQQTRWCPMHIYDQVDKEPHFKTAQEADEYALGERCFGGVDFSATTDLTAVCYIFPKLQNFAIWRYWIPEAQVSTLDRFTANQFSVWVRDGWINVIPGRVIEYDHIYQRIERDRQAYDLVDLNYDPMLAADVIQRLEKMGLTSVQVKQGFMLDAPMKELLKWIKSDNFHPGGNPVTRWNFEAVEVKQDDRERIYYVKPKRDSTGKRIDGVAAAVMATDGVMRRSNVIKKRKLAVGF